MVFEKHAKRKDNLYPVRLRVTHNRVQKYFPIGLNLSDADWGSTMSDNPKKIFKEHRIYIQKVEERAMATIKEIFPFSFEEFRIKFGGSSSERSDVTEVFQRYIDVLNEEERITTAYSYRNALVSQKAFMKHKHRKRIGFEDITVTWLKDYENWMLDKGRSISTIGIYLRSLRTIVNIAITEGNLKRELYPFGKRKYKIPATENVKKALVAKDIQKIYEYIPTNDREAKAKDMWIFTYLCNGMNFKDIAKLKYLDINQGKVTFIRSKTEQSGRQMVRPVTVMLLPDALDIIQKWGVAIKSRRDYIFGVFEENDTPEVQNKKIQQEIKTINKYMKRIGEDLVLPIKITTYTARHSYATMLKRSGVSTAYISESLGHKDLKTTQNYLDSFEDGTKLENQKMLLNFN
jgi:integrase